jgi:hypothetical protein
MGLLRSTAASSSISELAVTLTANTRLVPRSGVESRALDDGAVLVDMNSGACFELNQIGFEVWRALHEGNSISGICDTLTKVYVVEPGVLAADVRTLVEALIEARVIVVLAT